MAKEKKIKVKKKIDWKHEMALAPGYIIDRIKNRF